MVNPTVFASLQPSSRVFTPPPRVAREVGLGLAAMALPISIPDQSHAGANHLTTYVAAGGRDAPRTRSRSASRPGRSALKCGASDLDMSGFERARLLPKQASQIIARLLRCRGGAWLIASTSAVHLARGNAGQSDLWALCAPDRAIAVIYGNRSANK